MLIAMLTVTWTSTSIRKKTWQVKIVKTPHCLHKYSYSHRNNQQTTKISNHELFFKISGIQSLQSVLDQPKESWYTHDIVMLQWCYSDVVLAAISGTSVVRKFSCL